MSDKPDADLTVKELEIAYQQRGCPSGVLFHSDQGSQYGSRAAMALSHDSEHESIRQLQGQCADGIIVQKSKIGVAPSNGIHERLGDEAGYQLLPDGLLQRAASTSTQ